MLNDVTNRLGSGCETLRSAGPERSRRAQGAMGDGVPTRWVWQSRCSTLLSYLALVAQVNFINHNYPINILPIIQENTNTCLPKKEINTIKII